MQIQTKHTHRVTLIILPLWERGLFVTGWILLWGCLSSASADRSLWCEKCFWSGSGCYWQQPSSARQRCRTSKTKIMPWFWHKQREKFIDRVHAQTHAYTHIRVHQYGLRHCAESCQCNCSVQTQYLALLFTSIRSEVWLEKQSHHELHALL